MDFARRSLYVARYTFADFFDRTFKMIGHTARTTFLVSFPPYVVIAALGAAVSVRLVHAAIPLAIELDKPVHSAQFEPLIGPALWLLLLSLLSAAVGMFISAAITLHAAQVSSGRTRGSIGEIVASTWNRYFPRILLQGLLKAVIFVGILVVGFTPAVLFVVIAASVANPPVIWFLLAATAYFATIVLLTWIAVLLALSSQAIVFDDDSVFGGLRRSAYLVRGNFWRLFATILLSQIIFSFSIGLVTYPIIGGAMMSHVTDLSAATNDYSGIIQSTLQMLGEAGPAYAIAGVIQAVLYQLFFPVLWSLFYIDLKVRKRDFANRRVRSRLSVRRFT
ncbi:MAG TPA: hypothetical protein VMW73_08890 [Spirochaetia bacterium]|nr:hypothetical protein [Spirochaetia bacterium]